MSGDGSSVLMAYDGLRKWAGIARVKGPSWAKMPLLSLSNFGISVYWGMATGNGEF